MNEIIEIIMNDDELNEKDKTVLIQKVVMASHGMNRFINKGYFLHTEKKKDGSISMEIWYRNEDDETVTHGRTGWDSHQIVEFMKKELFKMKKELKKKL